MPDDERFRQTKTRSDPLDPPELTGEQHGSPHTFRQLTKGPKVALKQRKVDDLTKEDRCCSALYLCTTEDDWFS
jgi:hypothetical protein